MSYRVVAPLVLARDQEGRTQHRYEGAVITWLPEDQKRLFLDSGFVVEVGQPADDADQGDPIDDAGVADGDSTSGTERPASVATKDVLIDWLLEHDTLPDGDKHSRSALQRLNKDELWDLIEGAGV